MKKFKALLELCNAQQWQLTFANCPGDGKCTLTVTRIVQRREGEMTEEITGQYGPADHCIESALSRCEEFVKDVK